MMSMQRNGIAIRMEHFDTYFGLLLCIRAIVNQSKNITVQEAVRVLVSHLKFSTMRKSSVHVHPC